MNVLENILRDVNYAMYSTAWETAAGYDGDAGPPMPCRGTFWVDHTAKVKWGYTKTKDVNGDWWSFRIECGLTPIFDHFEKHAQRQGAKTRARVRCNMEKNAE